MAVLLLSGLNEHPCDVCVGLNVGVKHFSLSLIESEGVVNFCDVLMESCQVFPNVDVLVDLSVLDKAFNSGGMLGGLSSRELFYIVSRLKLMRNFSGLNVVGEGDIAEKLAKSF